jgi:hypothetical protein
MTIPIRELPHFSIRGIATGAFNAPVIPEPGTLGLLGTGLIGVGMARRKLKLGT